MRLKKAYGFNYNLHPEIKKAVDIAESLRNWAPDEEVEAVLNQIPESTEYFTFIQYAGEYGTEIYILYPAN